METGKITEFVRNVISIKIFAPENKENGFSLLVKTTSNPDIISVQYKNQIYSASHKQAFKHIMNVIDLACLSIYSSPHWIHIGIPFYPTLSIPLTKSQECKDALVSALENYLTV